MPLKNKKGSNLLYKEKISAQKLYNTANQNNSFINSYFNIWKGLYASFQMTLHVKMAMHIHSGTLEAFI